MFNRESDLPRNGFVQSSKASMRFFSVADEAMSSFIADGVGGG
jgi:hypothetical protein